jgi:hypothetical protein
MTGDKGRPTRNLLMNGDGPIKSRAKMFPTHDFISNQSFWIVLYKLGVGMFLRCGRWGGLVVGVWLLVVMSASEVAPGAGRQTGNGLRLAGIKEGEVRIEWAP